MSTIIHRLHCRHEPSQIVQLSEDNECGHCEIVRLRDQLMLKEAVLKSTENGVKRISHLLKEIAQAHTQDALWMQNKAREALDQFSIGTSPGFIDIVFDGPPAPSSGRFVEVEDEKGKSTSIGQWLDRGNGLWALRINRGDLGIC